MATPRTAYEIVGPEIDQATNYATQAFNNGINFLNNLANSVNSILTIPPLALTIPSLNTAIPQIQNFNIPNIPSLSSITTPIINTPNLDNIYIPNFTQVPDFTETIPTVNLVSPPSLLNVDLNKTPPNLNLSFVFPNDPVINLPPVPTIEQLNLPNRPSITLPNISDLPLPSITTPTPTRTFNYSEPGFDESTIDTVSNILLDMITNGKLGLPTTIEQSIWDRAKDREVKEHTATITELTKNSASKGFKRPPGSVTSAIDRAILANKLKLQELSREIAIKQFELLNENFKFAISTLLNYEKLSFDIYNQIQERALEIEKYIQDTSINLFNVALNKVQLELQLYNAYYDASLKQIEISLSKLREYRSVLEAEAIRADIDKRKIDIYLGQLQGVQIQVDVFTKQLEAINTKLNTQKIVLDNFKTELEVELAKIQANTAQIESYSKLLDGEKIKLDIYNSKVDAFAKRVQAYATKVEAEKSVAELTALKNDQAIKLYSTKLDGELKKADLILKKNSDLLEAYKTQLQATLAQFEAQVKQAQLNISYNDSLNRLLLAQTELANQEAKFNIELIKSKTEMFIDITSKGAEVSAGLARAALSALNIGASLSGSSSTNYNYNIAAESGSVF